MSETKASISEKLRSYFDANLFALLKPFFKKHKTLLIVCSVTTFLSVVLATITPLFIQKGINNYILNKDSEGLMWLVKWLIVVEILSFVLRVCANSGIAFFGQKMLYALRMKLFSKALKLSNDYYDRVPTGTTLTHITNDVESVRQFVSVGIVTVITSILKVVLIVGFMFYINLWLAGVTLFCIPVFILLTYWFKTRIRDGFRGVRKANSDINTQMIESLNGYREIALFQNRESSCKKFDKNNYAYYESYKTIIQAYAIYLPMVEVITHISTILVLLIAHYGVGQVIRPGDIFAFFTFINLFFRPLRDLAEQFNTFQAAMAAMERIQILENEPITVTDNEKEDPNLNANHISGITFDNVNFSYKEGTPVLKQMSFAIKQSEKIALVGSTGAGKSTINHLLNRLYDYQSGDITINNQNIREYSLRDLRSMIATIPQDVFLFTGSILENIRLFDESITEDMVNETIKSLHMQDFINSFTGGLSFEINESGSSLSNGEKQLIAFARAFLKKPGLIIFDEATANVDSTTEKRIEVALEVLLENRSAIIIAHRLSTIENVDRIFYLKNGEIVEEGKHSELINQDSHYRKLWEMQALASEV
jgi:ATP-binding cassette, subfamily B, multidrug efflux pump